MSCMQQSFFGYCVIDFFLQLMLFSDLLFIYLFLPLLLLFYFIVGNDFRKRIVLTVFSLLFYAWGRPSHLPVMLLLVLLDWGFGIGIARIKDKPKKRKALLILAVAVNLSLLVFYKYLGFFAEIVNLLPFADIPVLSFTMPIGISFFTFQAMSYVIDVYRHDAQPQKSFFSLLLYISFFPQLIAGPIVRYKEIEEQLAHRTVTASGFCDGFFRFSVGMAKKVLIADVCADILSSLYADTEIVLLGRWLGALLFTLQLYFDFSGYSDMAIGLGAMFGFRIPENFRYPLAADSATDFWRKWHMTLGGFFRDYVYIPLGGKYAHQMRNILIVWLLTGLWHGASFNFIVWGLYYALLLILEKKWLLRWKERIPRAVNVLLTGVSTVFGFSIFYFESDLLPSVGYLFGVGVDGFTDLYTNSILCENCILIAAALLLALPLIPRIGEMALCLARGSAAAADMGSRILKTVFTIAALAVCTAKLAGNTYTPFLYFRF
ncbi:MAG: MBOAT family O-acyltransferase [Eubacteriales bacterium]